MATVTGLTKDRMLEIEGASVVNGGVVGDDLILTKKDGTTINAGNVRGPQGIVSSADVAQRALILDAVTEGTPNDGLTNAQPGLGAVHNMLPATGGRILLRRGSYLMGTRLITTKQGMVLEGEGIDATKMLLSAAAFQVGCSDVLIKNMTIKGNVSNAQSLFQLVTTGAFRNWRFENVKFDGVSVVVSRLGSTAPGGGLLTSGAGLDDHVEFDHCEHLNYTEDGALMVRGTHHVTINRGWFHDLGTDINKGDAVKIAYGATEWRVLHTTFERCARDAIDLYDGHRGLVDGANIISPGVHGIEMKTDSATPTNPADRNRIVNTHIVGAGASTVSPSIQASVPNTIISNNLIEDGIGAGIRCGKTNDGVTRNENITLMGNRVINASAQGYYFGGVNGAVIIGNAATECGGRGFEVDTTTINSEIIGGAALNSSRGNTTADIW